MRQMLVPVVIAVLIGVMAAVGYHFAPRLLGTDADSESVIMALAEPECRVFPDGCVARSEQLALRLRFVKEPSAMNPTEVVLETTQPLSSATVDFQMSSMDMGLNRYRLRDDGRGGYRATMMLPVCVSGRRDWIARVSVVTGGLSYLAEFPFEAGR